MSKVRTRFAPSPTGYMHIGNLRTALYAYLYTKSNGGDYILRIEDTDQNRFVEGATQVIYDTLKIAGIKHDEGPDIGGNFGPYIQSQRKELYGEYAHKLVEMGVAYYCFCQKDESKEENPDAPQSGYDRKCRNLSKEEVEEKLSAGIPYVIRQKIPLEGSTGWNDLVYGEIVVENETLDDQILLKSDGMPTYNFANVIDDHLMGITHIIRGSEYLSSNPKYLLLYKAFGWDVPEYIHLPLICGKGEDGVISKLSKRHGAVSFQALVEEGYLPSAIINYIALLGWNPGTEQEIFTMDELIKMFSTEGIHKNPAVFDYQKLGWVNSEHLKRLDSAYFCKSAFKYAAISGTFLESKWEFLAGLMQSRIQKYSDIAEMIHFLYEMPDYDMELYINKKNKSSFETSRQYISLAIAMAENINDWTIDQLNNSFMSLAEKTEIKLGRFVWPVRIAVSGLAVTPGSAADIMYLLGKDQSLSRLKAALSKLESVAE